VSSITLVPALKDQHNIVRNPACAHQGRIWLRIGTQIYNDFGGCEKVGKQDCSCAAFKFQMIALFAHAGAIRASHNSSDIKLGGSPYLAIHFQLHLCR
jgi:hypothetical protein